MIIQPNFYLNGDRTGHFVENWPTWKYSKRLKIAAFFQMSMSSAFSKQNPYRILLPINFFQLTMSSADKHFYCGQK